MNDTKLRDLRVEISSDGMEATLHLEGGVSLELRDVLRELTVEHRLCDVLEDEVSTALALAASKTEPESLPGVCVARGTPPVDGEDGRLEWLGEFFESHAITLPDGSVDHYHHTRCSVYEGQHLARLIPPEPGVPGRNVQGEEIAASAGKPLSLALDTGVEPDPHDEQLLVASRGGQVQYDHGHLGVSLLLQVKEVDYSVGSVDFDGSVEVQGDVRARFEVRAGASVLVAGSVENAEIESKRQLEIRGPVLGRGEARLVSGANMILSSVREAEIRCDSNLVVARELLGCHGVVRGDLCVEHGRVLGCDLEVAGLVLVSELGSREEVRTRIHLGEAMVDNQNLLRLSRAHSKASDALRQFQKGEGRLLLHREAERDQAERFESLKRRQSALQAVERRARRREFVLRRRMERRRLRCSLTVQSVVHAGVEVSFSGCSTRHRFTEDVRGPLRVALSEDAREITITSL